MTSRSSSNPRSRPGPSKTSATTSLPRDISVSGGGGENPPNGHYCTTNAPSTLYGACGELSPALDGARPQKNEHRPRISDPLPPHRLQTPGIFRDAFTSSLVPRHLLFTFLPRSPTNKTRGDFCKTIKTHQGEEQTRAPNKGLVSIRVRIYIYFCNFL